MPRPVPGFITAGAALAGQTPEPEPDALCEACGEVVDTENLSVEAFEMSGQLLCDGCADEVFEANGQFGAGA